MENSNQILRWGEKFVNKTELNCDLKWIGKFKEMISDCEIECACRAMIITIIEHRHFRNKKFLSRKYVVDINNFNMC